MKRRKTTVGNRKNLLRVLLLGLALHSLGNQDVSGQAIRGRLESLAGLDTFVEQLMTDWLVPGVAVGVISMDEPEAMYLKGFGFSDLENRDPVTPRTVFSVGSCAKAFTSAAMATLVTDGALDWDTPLHEALPAFRLYDDESTSLATPRDLLLHRTGLSGYERLRELSTSGREGWWDRVQMLEPTSAFRERFRYSNLSYLMAGRVVEEVAGEPFEAYIRRRILQPLGMESTFLSFLQATEEAEVAIPYLNFWLEKDSNRDQSAAFFRSVDFEGLDASHEELSAPSGGVYSSLEDMMKWVQFQLGEGDWGGRRVISEEALQATHSSQIDIWSEPDGEEQTYLSYGMGWFLQDYRGHATVQHAGQVYGYMAQVSLLPEEGIGVVVLTNSYYHHLTQLLSQNIFDRLLGLDIVDRSSVLEEYQEVLRGMEEQARAAATRPDEAGTPPRPLEEYVGGFSHPLYGLVSVRPAGGSLEVVFRDRIALELGHFSNDTFQTNTGRVSFFPHFFLNFQVDPEGRVTGVRIPLDEWDEEILFHRVSVG